MVRATGYIQSLDDLRQIPVGLQADGTPVLLEACRRHPARPGPAARHRRARRRGRGGRRHRGHAPGRKRPQVIDAVQPAWMNSSPGLPEGVEIVETYDRST
jgi:copper/silver efflux system protein